MEVVWDTVALGVGGEYFRESGGVANGEVETGSFLGDRGGGGGGVLVVSPSFLWLSWARIGRGDKGGLELEFPVTVAARGGSSGLDGVGGGLTAFSDESIEG
jgi:hypothetical protein